MSNEVLTLRVDSRGTQADLERLDKALLKVEQGFDRLERSAVDSVAGLDRSLTRASRSMGQFAQISQLISRMRGTESAARQIILFSQAVDTLGRARTIRRDALKNFADFIALAATSSRINFNTSTVNSLRGFVQVMNEVAAARPISSGKLENFGKTIMLVAQASKLRINGSVSAALSKMAESLSKIGQVRGLTASKVRNITSFFEALGRFKGVPDVGRLERMFLVLGRIRVPSSSAIGRLENLFKVLATSTGIPNASRIARDLNQVAEAAARAANAIDRLPASMRTLGARAGRQAKAFVDNANGINRMNDQLARTPAATNRARRGIIGLNSSLDGMNARLNLGYQAGTLFTTVFSAFTLGAFVREVYRVNIEVLKLEKAMLFATGTFEAAGRATDDFLGLANSLGLSIDSIIEPFARFTISASAAGMSMAQSTEIFRGVSTALTVVGASSRQTELAFFGLTQMMQKGRVSSEEFNRQIGEQIPGNAVIGARALSQLEGRMVSVGEFFERMARGEILSGDFVPEYARQLEEMFAPLLQVALKRPDVALNRLNNTFKVFMLEVGRSGFMAEIGTQFERFNDLLTETDEEGRRHLNPTGQALARTLGENMASGVRLLVDVLEVLVNNIDTVINSMKLFLGIAVANTLKAWTTQAIAFSAAMAMTPARLFSALPGGRGAATAVTASAGAVNVAAGASMGADMASIVAARRANGGRAAGAPGRPVASAARGGNRGFGRAAAAASTTFDATARSGRALNSVLSSLGGGLSGFMRMLGSAVTSVGALRLAMLAVTGPIGVAIAALTAITVGLVAFSDKTTEVGGRSVQFGDILGGMFIRLGDLFASAKTAFSGVLATFGTDFDSLQRGAGDAIINVIAWFETLFEKIAGVAQGISTILLEVWDQSMGPWVRAASRMFQGDFRGALAEMGESFNIGERFQAMGEAISTGVSQMTNTDSFAANVAQNEMAVTIAALARERAEDRVAMNAELDAASREIEAQLARASEFQQQRQRVGELETMIQALQGGGRISIEETLRQTEDILAGRAPSTSATQTMGQIEERVQQRMETVLSERSGLSQSDQLAELRILRDELEREVNRMASPGRQSELANQLAGMSPADLEAMQERARNAFASVQSVLMQGGSPADQAEARLARAQEKLQDFNDAMAGTLGNFFTEEQARDFTAQVRRAFENMREQAQEAMDPVGTLVERRAEELNILELQSQGLQDLADFQEVLNGLNRQGYDLSVDQLDSERQLFEEQARRRRLLEGQVELQRELNELAVSRASNSSSRFEADFLGRVAAMANDGESLDAAMARLSRDNPERLEQARTGARAVEDARREDAQLNIERELARMVEGARLNDSAAQFQNDYRRILEDMTGLSGRSLAELEAAASAADVSLAQRFAQTRYEIENPPGFQAWVDGLDPLEERLQDIKTQFASDLSNTLTDALMGEDVDFSEMFERARRQMIQANVDQILANGFNGFQSGGGGFNFGSATGGLRGLFGGSNTAASKGGDSGGGFLSRVGSMFGIGSGGEETPFSTGGDTMSIQAQTVYVNGAIAGGGGGDMSSGGLSGLSSLFGGGAKSGAKGGAIKSMSKGGMSGIMGAAKGGASGGGLAKIASAMPGAKGAAAGGGGLLGGLGGMMGSPMGMLSVLTGIGGLFGGGDEAAAPIDAKMPGGILGAMSNNQMTGTAVAAKSNPFADAINFGLDLFTGGQYSTYAGMGNAIGSVFAGFFEEGGVSTSPVMRAAVPAAMFANVPHYAEGTPNTSGAMPAMLHPDEAVIPLSRGRKVPVEMPDSGRSLNVSSNITIMAPDPDSFRKSEQAMLRKQNRDLRKAAHRNFA